MKTRHTHWLHITLAIAVFSGFSVAAHAQVAGLPWDGPLKMVSNSLTGPIAKSIGVVALAASGGMLAFGGELSDFTKRIMMVVLALSVMLLAQAFMDLIAR